MNRPISQDKSLLSGFHDPGPSYPVKAETVNNELHRL